MWGHYTRITITHHCGSGAAGPVFVFIAGIGAYAAYIAVAAIIPLVAIALLVLATFAVTLAVILTGVKVYTMIRDKPVYEQFQKDTQRALDAKHKHDMIYATSQRVEGDDSCQDATANVRTRKAYRIQ